MLRFDYLHLKSDESHTKFQPVLCLNPADQTVETPDLKYIRSVYIVPKVRNIPHPSV